MADRWVLAHNLSDTPLVVDDETGATLDGGAWGAIAAEGHASWLDPDPDRLVQIFPALPAGDDLDRAAAVAIAEVRERNAGATTATTGAGKATPPAAPAPKTTTRSA